MNMIMTPHNTFSLSRVWLLLRLSWTVYRRPLLISLGLLFFLLWFIAHVDVLFGEWSYRHWQDHYLLGYGPEPYIMVSIFLALATILATLSNIVGINRQTRHHTPGAYTLLPATIGEKLLSLALQSFVVLVLAILVALAAIGAIALELNHQALQQGSLWSQIFGGNYFVTEFTKPLEGGEIERGTILAFLMPLSIFLAYAFSAIHFRRVLSALLMTSAVIFVGIPVLLVQLLGGPAYEVGIGLTPIEFAWMYNIFFSLLVIGLSIAIYYRFKKLQVK